MKRYFLVNEYFGCRVYDSLNKKEVYFDHDNTKKIKKLLAGDYEELDNVKPNMMSAPLKISMNITKRCNLRCKQCFSDSGVVKDVELTTQEMYKLFDDMRENGTFFICIGGGEPLTRPDLLDILEYGKNKQLAVSIVSNGLLFTKQLIEQLNTKDLDTIWISFDGEKENHEYLRGRGTFDKTVEAVELISKYSNAKKAIRMSINKHNLDDYKQVLKIAEDYNFDIIRFTPILSFGRAKNEDLVITQEQYIKFLNEIKQIKSKVNIVYPNMPNSDKIWIGTNGFGCHCGREAIWIDEVGNYSGCIFYGTEYNIGNIKQSSYMDLWKLSLEQTEMIKGNEICKSCKNYTVCRGGCRARVYTETGSFDGVDPLCPLKRNFLAS